MGLSLRYMFTRTLEDEPQARIADEHVAPLSIEWVGISSTRFASHAGFLYFVDSSSQVPAAALDPASMFAVVVPESLERQCEGIPRIVLPDNSDLDRIFDHLVRTIERYRSWHDTVKDLLAADAPYQDIVDITAKFIPRPLYIADATWRMISRVDFEMCEISATWHYQSLHDGLYPLNIVEKLNRTGDYNRISNLPRAKLLTSEAFTIPIIAKPIRHSGKLVGYFFIIDTWGDLGYCEVEIAQELGTLLAPIMAARSTSEGHIAGFQDNFITQIIDGLMTSKRDIARELSVRARWSVESDFRMATVRFEPNELDNYLLHMRAMGLLAGDFDCQTYFYRDTAIALFCKADVERDAFDEHLSKICSTLGRVVVLSNRFNDFSQFATYFEQNIWVHRRIEGRGGIEPHVALCDSHFRNLLADHCSNALPGCYEANVLYAYDQAHNTRYCTTLLAYLQNERNAVATANALYLHRNTLRNHLAKIQEITGADLDNTDARFHLLISLNTLLNAGK